MLKLCCGLSADKLCEKWDDKTSPSRFAGNDDNMDNIFMANRNGNKVKLVRKARNAMDPFATIFRGKICKDSNGSCIKGYFTKSILDYIIILVLLAFDLYICISSYLSGSLTANIIFGCIAFLAILVLLAVPLKPAKRKYTEFISDITKCDE